MFDGRGFVKALCRLPLFGTVGGGGIEDGFEPMEDWLFCLLALLNLLTREALLETLSNSSFDAGGVAGDVIDIGLTELVDVNIGYLFTSVPILDIPVMLACKSSKFSGGRNSGDWFRSFWALAENFGCDMFKRTSFTPKG
jgi:hypothetical protein